MGNVSDSAGQKFRNSKLHLNQSSELELGREAVGVGVGVKNCRSLSRIDKNVKSLHL